MDAHGSAPRLLHLDGWRGLAILLVLLGHFTPYSVLGALGVDLFFALSGRLMAELLLLRKQALPDFLVRRASRILPALIFYCGVMALALSGPASSGGPDWHLSALAMLGFFQNYLPARDVLMIFEHSWTLAVEEHCYLFLAALALLCGRRPDVAAFLALTAAGLALANGSRLEAMPLDGAQLHVWRTDVRAVSILLPFAIFLLLHNRLHRVAWAWSAPASLAAGILVLSERSLPVVVQFSVGTGLLGLAAATIDVSHKLVRRCFSSKFLVWPGLMSFSLYLWNQPFFCAKLLGEPAALCLLLAVAAGAWSYYRVERPARAALNARWARREKSSLGDAKSADMHLLAESGDRSPC